jgi:hypothetical protein
LKEIKNHIIALMAAVLLAACSNDSNELVPDTPEQAEEEKGLTMGMSASAPDFVNAAEPEEMARETLRGTSEAITRSWTPPSGYLLYSEFNDDHGNTYQNFASNDLTRKSINAFFTRATGDEPTPVAPEDPTYPRYANYPYHGRLSYKSSTEKWQLTIRKVKPELVLPGDYYVYGFTPSAAADDATIAILSGETSYTAGAKLTIKGLRTAGYDACVTIGAKEGPDADHDNGLTAGDFKFDLKTGESVKNYLYLLFDHLSSALSISIKVDGTYNTLRTIKLKQLALQTATETGLMAEKADVEVTLNHNDMGTNPITTLTYTPTGTSGTGTPVFQTDDGLTLTPGYKSFLSHFLPISGVTKVVVTCTYDIYDKNVTAEHPDGNLIRKDSKATNTIRLADIIPYFPGVQRGWKYGINMTVVPTYLYMLSEPDLENPRMVVN